MKSGEIKWLVGSALILLAALVIQSGLLAYAMYVLLGLMLLSRLLARDWLANIEAERTVEAETAEIDDEVPARLLVRNGGRFPVPWVLLEDLLPQSALAQRPPRLRIKGKRMLLKMLRPGQEFTMKYRIHCQQRGYYQVGPLLLESGDLFGLHRRHRVETKPAFLLVYPKVVPMAGYDIASRRPIGDVKLTLRLYEDPTRIAGVRRYEAGDPLNRVHWRATARTGQLHSKVYEPTTLAGASILLDFHQAGYPSRGEPHRSELAVTTAASLAHAVATLGQPIGLATNGRDAAERIRLELSGGVSARSYRTRAAARRDAEMRADSDRLQPLVIPTSRGLEQFQHIREALARVELTDGLPFPRFVLEVTPRLPRDATVLAILPQVSVETAVALGSLKQQGFAVTAVLVMMDENAFEDAYGRLVAQSVRDVRHVTDEASLGDLCGSPMQRASPYSFAVEA
jgi:uncharacterized protein (DUF58 family)